MNHDTPKSARGHLRTIESSSTPSLLDRVLSGLDDHQKARVLELVVRLGIEQDDPLWLIAIAIGQLQVMVEDAPQGWQELFVTFQVELNQWTATHLETLQVIAEESESVARLAATSAQLSSILSELVQASLALTQRLPDLENASQRSGKQLTESLAPLSAELLAIKRQISKYQGYLDVTYLKLLPKVENRTATWSARAALLLSSLAVVGMGFIGMQQHRMLQGPLQQLTQQSSWQLENVIRTACVTGAKDAESAECQNP
ncbi:MAG: DUF6753 family protein [Cyanobacteria bacterium P01_A01_bin.17]